VVQQRLKQLWYRYFPFDDVQSTGAEEAAFARFAAGVTARDSPKLALFLIAALALWWPTDLIVFADNLRAQESFALWRGGLLIMLLPSWFLFPRVWIERAPATVFCIVSTLGLGYTSWCMARIGGFDGPWFFFLLVAPILTVLLLAPFVVRTVAAFVASTGICVAFWLGCPPGTWDHPDRNGGISMLVFTTFLAIGIGHAIYRLTLSNFTRRLRIEAQEERMQKLNESLEQRVAEQTRALRGLARHLQTLQERERATMAREIHDQLGQDLIAIRYGIANALSTAPEGSTTATALEGLEIVLDRTGDSVHRLLQRLRPRVLDEVGLSAAVEWLARTTARQSGIQVDFETSVEHEVDSDVASAAFRIVQEALTNVVRHASASRAWVEMADEAGELAITVRDDGRGFGDIEGAVGFGLLGIRERALAFGGRATFGRSPTGGAVVDVRLACPAA